MLIMKEIMHVGGGGQGCMENSVPSFQFYYDPQIPLKKIKSYKDFSKINVFIYVYCFMIYVYLSMFVVYPLFFHDLRL